MNLRRFLVFILSAAGWWSAAAADKEVELITSSRVLRPTSTFEVRFAAQMVAPERVGSTDVSPIVFQPEVKGDFVWLSSRSGSFRPNGILPLGQKFVISLRPDLRDAQGKLVGGSLNETVETPPMRLKGSDVRRGDPRDADANPMVLLLFNTNVDMAAAAKFISWRNAEGQQVSARVEQADPSTDRDENFYSWNSDDGSLATWSESMLPQFAPKSPSDDTSDEDELNSKPGSKQPPRPNLLAVRPEHSLSPGKDWQVVLGAGLPSTEWKIGLPSEQKVMIGTVRPFELSSLTAESNRSAKRRIEAHFSKPLGPTITHKTVREWFRLDPEPPNTEVYVSGATVTFTGDFALGSAYRVTVKSGVPAAQPFTLPDEISKEVRFEKIAPRLYFEDFATHQLLHGSRRFRLLSVNVPRIRLSAILFQGDHIPAALAAYDKYQEFDENAPPDEPYQKVDVEKLKGKRIWSQDLTNPSVAQAPDDVELTTGLNWDVILGQNKTGAVLLTAESIDPVESSGHRVGAQAFVQLTDLGALWKRDKEHIFWHGFSLTTGKSQAGIKLRLLDNDRKQLAQAVTDTHGNAQLPCSGDDNARWVAATLGRDSHVVAINNGDASVPTFRLGLPETAWNQSEEGRASVYLFTDRGVYKPGETLHLKGFARAEGPQGAAPAGAKRLLVTAQDSREREFFRKEISLNVFGSFTADLNLPESGRGRFEISVKSVVDGENLRGSCSFQVQDYRPNSFEIGIPLPAEAVGESSIQLPVTAKYFMGKPLSRAKLTWSLTGRDTAFAPEGLNDYLFCDDLLNYRLQRALGRISQLNASGEGILDANGSFPLQTQLQLNSKAPQPRAAKLICEITDINQQTVSKSIEFVRQSSDFYFGVRRFDAVFKEGDPLPLSLIAVTPEGKPLSKSVKATVRLTRIDWQTNRLDGAGDTTEFETKPELQVVWEKELTTEAGQGTDRKPVPVPLTGLTVDRPGEYLLEVLSKDDGGREVVTSTSFEVAGKGQLTWDYRNPYVIDVSSDKDSYQPGQIATLLVKTPISGEALVTIEQDRVMRSFLTTLSGNAPSIHVPILETDAPNVFVSVMVLRGSEASPRKVRTPEYRIGYCQLKVSRPREKLNVSVTTSAAAVQPGNNMSVEAVVRDFAGKPVVGAEVTLYAVDEGILSLTGYKTPDALAFFNQLRALGVTTSLTLPTMLKEDASEEEFANKGYLIGDGKGGAAPLDGLRTKFIACAYWNASLYTDSVGRIKAQFAVPDSLTRYRVIAIATSKTSWFGSGESKFEVNKPIMLEPSLPRFGNVGDKVVIRAILHNSTNTAGEADVEVAFDDLVRATETRKHVILQPKADIPIDLPVEFVGTGLGKWRWAAKFHSADNQAEYQDAVETTLQIGYPATLLREVTTRRIDDQTGEIGRIGDPQIWESKGNATVALANSRTVEMHEAVRQLLEYPYGCIEQTTSSLLPWLTVRDLASAFPELQRSDAEVKKAVNRGFDLLLSMQTPSGGMSYWPKGTRAELWSSAYGGLGFVLARKAGFAVPDANLNRLLNYISAQLRGSAKAAEQHENLSDRCLAVYTLALAGKAEPAYHDLLFKYRDKFTAEDRALLALAILESNGPVQMVDELLQPPVEEGSYLEECFGSVAREYALNLLAWVRYRPRDPKVDELATDLFQRRVRGHWHTTQGNAWSLLALASYIRTVESGDPNSKGQVSWGEVRKGFSLTKSDPAMTLNFAFSNLKAAPSIVLQKEGGTVFSELTVEARPKIVDRPKQDQGYSLTRRYARVSDDGKLAVAENLRVGDRVLVTLDVEVRRRATYVAVEDPLPSVFEPINPAFKSQETLAGQRLGRDWISDYQEMRNDRVLFFADMLYPGRYSLRYLARVVAAGEAATPSAKIEEMYHPEQFGLTETGKIKTEALQ